MKKKVISLALVFSLMAVPTSSFAIISGIIEAVKGVIGAVNSAIQVATLAQEIHQIASFPGEYVRELNYIIKEINALKKEAERSKLPVGDIKFFLDITSTTLFLTKQSLESFNKIMGRLSAISEDLAAGAADSNQKIKSTEIQKELAAMRMEHNENMRALFEVRSMISNMRTVLTSSQQGRITVNKLNNFNL